MHYDSFVIVNSRLAPDVRYTLNKQSDVRRALLTRANGGPLDRLQRILIDAKAQSQKPKDEFDPARYALTLQTLHAEHMAIEAGYILTYVRSIDGLFIDGKVPTPTDFVADAPDTLRSELITLIKQALATADPSQLPALVN